MSTDVSVLEIPEETAAAELPDQGDPAFAFGEGGDARQLGLPLECNPYHRSQESGHLYWRMGWLDVEENFGRWVKGRWAWRKPPLVLALDAAG